MDIGEIPGYRLAIRSKYDAHYADLTIGDARARRAALGPFIERVLAALELPDDGAHLDIGCGDGLCAISVAKLRPRIAVLGLDASATAVSLARRAAAEEGVRNATFMDGDAESPPDAHFDRISALSVLNLMPDKTAVFSAWRKVVVPGGRLVIADGFAMSGSGAMGVGALSPDGLGLAARRAGWSIGHREDVTPLVAKLHAQGAWPWPEYLRPGSRYAIVALDAR